MIIDGNESYKHVMEVYYSGDKQKGMEMDTDFINAVNASETDHCSCPEPCRWHGKCRECVILHRGHRDHLPYCFHSMVNERLNGLAALTEGNVSDSKMCTDCPKSQPK